MRILTKWIPLAALAAYLAAGPASAQIADTNTPSSTTPASKAKSKSKKARTSNKAYTGIVASVDNDAKTLTLKNHDKPFQITSKTRIDKKGEPALLTDVPVGETVTIRAKEDASGALAVSSIRVGPPPKRKKKAIKKEAPPAMTEPATAPAAAPAPAPTAPTPAPLPAPAPTNAPK